MVQTCACRSASPCLNAILAHSLRPVHTMQLIVEAARVTHRLAVVIPAQYVNSFTYLNLLNHILESIK